MTKDPNILLSLINTMLRDKYSSLDSLCDVEDLSMDEVIEILDKISYKYDINKNQFIYFDK